MYVALTQARAEERKRQLEANRPGAAIQEEPVQPAAPGNEAEVVEELEGPEEEADAEEEKTEEEDAELADLSVRAAWAKRCEEGQVWPWLRPTAADPDWLPPH
eukprot:16448422-Heterocapsa_arctica.AAC.1